MKRLSLAVCVTIIAALIVGACGCTTTSNNTATSPSTTHDALLEKFVNATQQKAYANSSEPVQAWDVTWNNGTSVTILETVKVINGTLSNATLSANETILSFPATQDATNFLSAFDKSNYSLTSTNYANDTSTGIYLNVTGHAPSVYKDYSYTEGSILSAVKVHSLIQLDNIIEMTTATATL